MQTIILTQDDQSKLKELFENAKTYRGSLNSKAPISPYDKAALSQRLSKNEKEIERINRLALARARFYIVRGEE